MKKIRLKIVQLNERKLIAYDQDDVFLGDIVMTQLNEWHFVPAGFLPLFEPHLVRIARVLRRKNRSLEKTNPTQPTQ